MFDLFLVSILLLTYGYPFLIQMKRQRLINYFSGSVIAVLGLGFFLAVVGIRNAALVAMASTLLMSVVFYRRVFEFWWREIESPKDSGEWVLLGALVLLIFVAIGRIAHKELFS